MPEKPEVVTVSKNLEKKLIGRKIIKADVYWDNIIIGSEASFKEIIQNETIESITTRGKWIVLFLTTKALLIHLRMEGKFFFRPKGANRSKHEHVVFLLDNGEEMRFHDVRKFGKIALLPKEEVYKTKPLSDLGLEYNDESLTPEYLLSALRNKRIAIKTSLLDQSIITGIGNIYDDEILFASAIHPLRASNTITKTEALHIIDNTKIILDQAIKKGGTTIRSYTSSEGVHGLFQQELKVHGKQVCMVCQSPIEKIVVGGRGTYYCPHCQKNKGVKKCQQQKLKGIM